jgi:hypothetical protein
MHVRVSIQVAGHLASGAVVRDDLVIVPDVDASVLRHDGPYVAVIVNQETGPVAPWEQEPAPDPDQQLTIPSVQWIRCACEEAHTTDGLRFQAGFRLEMPYTERRRAVDVDMLLLTPQAEVWPEAASVLATVPAAPALGRTKKVAWHTDKLEQASWCRFVPWC